MVCIACMSSGAAQAGVICYLLYLLSTKVDGYFDAQQLPSQYTARNVAVLIQTVVRGLAYLITFIFGANAAGLTGVCLSLCMQKGGTGWGGILHF
jgi:hypothetical protein